MIFKAYYQPVKDPLDIYLRVRDFVPSWRLFFNKLKSRYEVHDINSGCWQSLVAVLPFEQIDFRTIRYLAKHNINNFDKIINEIEFNNADIVRKQMYQRSHALEQSLRNFNKR